MPHLAVSWDSQLVEKRALSASMVVGRSSECDIVIRDVHLSRRHCKIDSSDGAWCVVDMDSKNGLLVNGQRVNRQLLADGDVLRMGKEGRLRITFYEAPLPPEDQCLTLASPVRFRPSDPGDTMDGTVAGFTLLEPGEGAGVGSVGRFPSPQPQPRTPAAYERDDVARMISALVSSSWDSIYEQARQKAQLEHATTSADSDRPPTAPRRRPDQPVDLSLQVQSDGQSESAVAISMTQSPMRVNSATQVGQPIAPGPEHTSITAPTEPAVPHWVASASLPAPVPVTPPAAAPAVEQWMTDSPGSLVADVPQIMPEKLPIVAAMAPAPEVTRTLPRPQPRHWGDLLARPRMLSGVAALVGLTLMCLSPWYAMRRSQSRTPARPVESAMYSGTATIEHPTVDDTSSSQWKAWPPAEIAPALAPAPNSETVVPQPPGPSSTELTSAPTSQPAQDVVAQSPATQPVAPGLMSASGAATAATSDSTSQIATLPMDGSAQPAVTISSDLSLGLDNPFGPAADERQAAVDSGTTGDGTASLLDMEVAPATAIPDAINPGPAQ